MNKETVEFQRRRIKEMLGEVAEPHHRVFRQMYSHHDKAASLETIVDRIPEESLGWAMTQLTNTITAIKNQQLPSR